MLCHTMYHKMPCYTPPSYHTIMDHSLQCLPYYTITCPAILYHTTPYTIQWHYILHYTVPYDTIPYHVHAISCHAMPHHTITYINTIPRYANLCHTTSYHIIPHRTVPYRTVPYRTVPYRTVPYRTVPYRTIPYHTIPYHYIKDVTKIFCQTMLHYVFLVDGNSKDIPGCN